MIRICTAVLLFLAPLARGQNFPPPPKGHWAVDRTGKVSAATLQQLDAIADEVEASGGGQLGVLVIDSTSGQTPRPFATRIFNQWGIGHAAANDGLFLFVALKDRKSEIVLGSGTRVTSTQTDVVMRDDVVANFKRGAIDEGLLAAARSLKDLCAPQKAAPSEPAEAPTVDERLMAFVRHEAVFPEHSPRSWVVDPSNLLNASARASLDVAASDVYASSKGRVFYLVVQSAGDYPDLTQLTAALEAQVGRLSSLPLAIVAWDESSSQLFLKLPGQLTPNAWQAQALTAQQAQLADAVLADRAAGLAAAGKAVGELLLHGLPQRPTAEVLSEGFDQHEVPILGSFGVTALGGLAFVRRWLRRRPRQCEHCHQPRELLSEAEEDDHLSSTAQLEESIGSVEYDVWWCGRCNDALVLDYTSWFSRYGRCPSCRARTKSSESTTLVYATTSHGGEVRVDEQCAACSYRNSYTRTTSRLSDSSDSSSSSSFGGGSSSGGGSSGSW